MSDERLARTREFRRIRAETMFPSGSQLVFHTQLSRRRDAASLVRGYITDTQRAYVAREQVLNLAA